MILLKLTRTKKTNYQTLGELEVLKPGSGPARVFATLELPWQNNQRNISCVPTGFYRLTKRFSPKYGDHFLLEDVPNRSLILIHHGNYAKDTKGCILIGRSVIDLDGDRRLDITNSQNSMETLNALTEGTSELFILIQDK